MKYLSLVFMFVLGSSLVQAQNCTLQNCHIAQTSSIRVVAENQQNVCFLVQSEPEVINVTCQTANVTKFSLRLAFFIGDCVSGNFLGNADIQWSLCRTSDNIFSWDVAAGPLERTGTLF
jgi:hypothetical protein